LLDKAIAAGERMALDGRLTRWRRARSELSGVGPESSAAHGAAPAAVRTAAVADAVCARNADVWELTANGERARVPHTVGMAYLATLLASPGTDVAAGVLAGVDVVSAKQDVFDEQTRRALRRRVGELEDAIDVASLREDTERVVALQRELDDLLAHARDAAGMSGRSRHFDDAAERARTSVQKAIRRAIARIANDAPSLGDALRASVRTGYQCCYEPVGDAPRHWTVRGS
jgi:hypothetical protein